MVPLVVLALACHPKPLGLVGDGDTDGDVTVGAHLVADPPSADFGDVDRGTTSTVTVSLRNDGDEAVHVTGAAVGDTGGGFSVGGLPGLARGPVIAVDPTSWDFGAPTIGCAAARTISIENVGNADLVVSALDGSASSTDLTFAGAAVPLTIAPGASQDVEVDDVPLDTFADEAWLAIDSNDAVTPEVSVALTGSGTFYGDQLDTFAADGATSELDLTAVPVEATLEVRVDGFTLTKGWSWDGSANAVDVVPAPKAGSTVEVRYDVLPPSCP